MGFLSSLFGSSKSKPATNTNVISQKLPEEIAPFAKEVLTDAQKLYKANVERGYDPYTGKTIAPFVSEQEQAMAGISGLVGTSKPLQEEALATYRRGGDEFTAEVAEQFMSPYQQSVTDIEKRKAQENFESKIMPQFEAQAVGAGGMSGLAELQRGQSQLLADIQAKGQQKAFEDARKGFEQQQAREQAMAGNISRMGPAMVASGLQEQGALQSVGEQKQQLGQAAMDDAYYRFLEEQQFPQQQLANYSGFVYGNPAAGMVNTNQTGSSTPFQPSFGQQLLGAGLQLGGAYLSRPTNIYSGKPPGMAAGGGIAGLINKANGGGFEDEMAMGIEEQVTVPAPTPAVDPAQVGKDRTAIFDALAAKSGKYGSMQTPEELQEANKQKQIRRAGVQEQIASLMGAGELTLGKTMMAIGAGISKGGGLEIGKALEKMTDQLMKDRKDLSKVQAQTLLANLDMDEVTDEMIRTLPKRLRAYVASVKKASLETRLTEAKIADLDPKNKLRKDIAKLSIGLGGKEGEGFIASVQSILGGQNVDAYEAKNPGAGDILEDLDDASIRRIAIRAATLMKENPGTIINDATLIAFDQLFKAKQLKEDPWSWNSTT